jgi:threonine dehydratase
MATELLKQPTQTTYTGNEAYRIIDRNRVAVDEHFSVDPLYGEFPSYASQLGVAKLYLARSNSNRAGTFKWRGALVGASALQKQGTTTIVVPSAGNHARGAVLAAKLLGLRVNIVVPTSAPPAKKEGLCELWDSDQLQIYARGSSFNESLKWTLAHPELGELLHPFDNPNVIAGQGTLVDDILAHSQPDHIVVPVGGAGLLAGIVQKLEELGNHHTQLHAIEPEGSNSLSLSLQNGTPTASNNPNMRYGGSAVRQIGDHTFTICLRHRNRIHTHHVREGEVDAVISSYQIDRRDLWRDNTPNLEPTTLVAIAGTAHVAQRYPSETIVVIGTGQNAPL